MLKSSNNPNHVRNHLLIRIFPYLIVCALLLTSIYYYKVKPLSKIQENQESQIEYESLMKYSNYLNNIHTLLVKILNMPNEYTRDIVFKELEKSIKEWNDDNTKILIQSLKKFVSDIATLNQEIEKSVSEITIDHKRKTETLQKKTVLKNEIENDIEKVKSIVSKLSQELSDNNDKYFNHIEKSIINAFANFQNQNQESSNKLPQDLNQINTTLKNTFELIQKILNCRIYIHSMKDFIVLIFYANNTSSIQNIKNDMDALFNDIKLVLNQFDNQRELAVVKGQLKTSQNLIKQLVNYKMGYESSIQNQQDSTISRLKNDAISHLELMAHQLKQYKDDVAIQTINDLSAQINQAVHTSNAGDINDRLNDIRSNLNDVHSMYHIRDVLYEMSIKINHLCVPANKNVLMLTQKEIRPLYDKLTKMVSHSNSLRQLFSNNNFYSLMKDMDRINNKIEELFRLETSLENIQEKLKFEAKNKEYVITNVFINSNQSLIKIIHSIQTIEKKISECQLRIKENNLQQYHHVVNQMILLISFFSMLLIFSFLLRYHFEKNIIANQAEGKDASARLKSSVNRKLIFSAIFLLIISLSFNALLTLGSLEKLYVESTVSQYRIIGTDLQRNIDRSLRYGKRIDKFVGMDRILSETKYSLTTKYLKGQARIQWKDIDLNVAIALPDWKIIYSTDKNMIDTQMPKAARVDYTDKIKENASKTLSDWTEYKDRYYITLPVKGGESKDWAGTVIIDFNDTQIKAFLKNIFVNNMKMIGAILMIGSLLLIISLTFIVYRSKNNLPRILISIVMLIIIGISQAVFSLINSYEFKKFYLQINIQKSEIMTKMLKEDIDYLLSKGVKIHKLVKMENLMKEVIDVSPELKDISIFDSNDKILHLANKDMAIDFNRSPIELQKIDLSQSDNDPEFQLKKKLIKVTDSESTQPVYKGTIITNISKAALFDKIFEIRIDSATVFIISILFMVELLIMIFRIIRSSSQTEAKKTKIEFSDIRPVTFIFFFAFDLCISFLPLYMEQLYVPMFGLSKDIVLSLPIAGEMFFAGITSIIVGWLLDRVNWHLPFLYGLIICSIGSFYSWLSPDAYHLLFARCFTGIGYGLSFMAGQGFVVTYTDNKTKTQGLTQLFAGLMAGSICGGAAGAMIADRIGFAPIFFISAVLLIVTVLYTLYFMRGGFQKKVVKKITEEQGVVKEKQGLLLLKFIFNRNIASLLILGILPTAFSIVGFINFFYPVYLNRLGETQSNIGRIYMIYGLCLIYIAPMLSKFVDRSDNKKLFIVITGMIGGLAFTTFYFMGGLWATVVTVLLLGVSSSFDASRTYALNLNITKTLGEGTAMGIFNLAEKIGQVVGPIIFGLFFITASLNNTMAAFGAIYIIITLLFLFTAQSDKKLKRLERG